MTARSAVIRGAERSSYGGSLLSAGTRAGIIKTLQESGKALGHQFSAEDINICSMLSNDCSEDLILVPGERYVIQVALSHRWGWPLQKFGAFKIKLNVPAQYGML